MKELLKSLKVATISLLASIGIFAYIALFVIIISDLALYGGWWRFVVLFIMILVALTAIIHKY